MIKIVYYRLFNFLQAELNQCKVKPIQPIISSYGLMLGYLTAWMIYALSWHPMYITWGLCERRNFPWYRKRFNLIELELSTTTSNFVTRLCFPSSFLAAKASCQYGTIWKAVSFNYSLSMAWMVYSAPLLNYKKRWKLVEKVKSALTVLAGIVLDNIWIEKKKKKTASTKAGISLLMKITTKENRLKTLEEI